MRSGLVRPLIISLTGALVVLSPSDSAVSETRAPIWVVNCAPYAARVSMYVKSQGADWQLAATFGAPVTRGSPASIRLPSSAAAQSYSGYGMQGAPPSEVDGVRFKAEFLDPLDASSKSRSIGQATITATGRFNERDHYLLGFEFLATPQHQFGKYNDVQFSGKTDFGVAPEGVDSKSQDPPACEPMELPTAPPPVPRAT